MRPTPSRGTLPVKKAASRHSKGSENVVEKMLAALAERGRENGEGTLENPGKNLGTTIGRISGLRASGMDGGEQNPRSQTRLAPTPAYRRRAAL